MTESPEHWIVAIKDRYSRITRFACDFKWQRRFLSSNRDQEFSGRIDFARGAFLQIASNRPAEITIDIHDLGSQTANGRLEEGLGTATATFGLGVVYVSALLLGLREFFAERQVSHSKLNGTKGVLELSSRQRLYRYQINDSYLIEEIQEHFSISSGGVVEITVFSHVQTD